MKTSCGEIAKRKGTPISEVERETGNLDLRFPRGSKLVPEGKAVQGEGSPFTFSEFSRLKWLTLVVNQLPESISVIAHSVFSKWWGQVSLNG